MELTPELELQMQNNHLLREMLDELKEVKEQLRKQSLPTDTVSPQDAMVLIGVTNPRYLTHFVKDGVLNRRKGGVSYLYFRTECIELATRIKEGRYTLPTIKQMYA